MNEDKESLRDVWPPNSVTEPVLRSTDDPEPVDPTVCSRDIPVDPLIGLKATEHALDLARVRARECRQTVLAMRGAFSKALAAWNLTMPVQTQIEQARQYCATSQLERARKAAAGLLPYQPSVSQTAKAYAGGGHNVQRGHGRAYARGAVSRAQAMEIEAGKLRAAAAAAKPSGPAVKP